ncbi:hypothetical protein N2601_31080 (plasmid) [Rhizobium sp. CB3060]|uniref:hypothetical protein n=1 Tax=Rhizobium sp. CB3060 TaxID=3138255 RepID=UPI0021A8F4B7|nr:hypothetical protein [Rhizobium tropici]UWU25434.1 hypothetical protein N2601_31080 [Rhizobium tropici]
MQSNALTHYTDLLDLSSDGVLQSNYTVDYRHRSFEEGASPRPSLKGLFDDTIITSSETETDANRALANFAMYIISATGGFSFGGLAGTYSYGKRHSWPFMAVDQRNLVPFLSQWKVALAGWPQGQRLEAENLLDILAGDFRSDIGADGVCLIYSARSPVVLQAKHIANSPTVLEDISLGLSDEARSIKSQMEIDRETVETSEIADVIVRIENVLRDRQWSTIDELFRSLDLTRCPPAFLVVAIRDTFPVREKLLTWKSFLISIRGDLERRNMNATKILRGLESDAEKL